MYINLSQRRNVTYRNLRSSNPYQNLCQLIVRKAAQPVIKNHKGSVSWTCACAGGIGRLANDACTNADASDWRNTL